MGTIKLTISIEQQTNTCLRFEATVFDILFSEYSRLMDYEEIASNLKKALTQLKGFKMLTIYLNRNDKQVKSVRFVKECGGTIKKSFYNINSYDSWINSDSKQVYTQLKSFVDLANVEFIELIKIK